jgi:hypothetical protein
VLGVVKLMMLLLLVMTVVMLVIFLFDFAQIWESIRPSLSTN